MRKSAVPFVGVAAILLSVGCAAPAHAITNTWVASTGSGTSCTRAAPCADFQTAINATDNGGTVNCVDSGSFGTVFLSNKSLTIDCSGHFAAIRPTTGTAGVSILNGTFNGTVTLRGLSIEGPAGTNGVDIVGGTVHIDKCRIAGFRHVIAARTAIGIWLRPTDALGKLYVTDSIIEENGADPDSGGIVIAPRGRGLARVVIDRTRVNENKFGIVASGAETTEVTIVQIHDTVVAGSFFQGITATTTAGHGTVSMTIDRTSSLLTGVEGIVADGPGAFILLGNSTVMSNILGLSPINGGKILSYQSNQLTGNLTDGAPTGVITER